MVPAVHFSRGTSPFIQHGTEIMIIILARVTIVRYEQIGIASPLKAVMQHR